MFKKWPTYCFIWGHLVVMDNVSESSHPWSSTMIILLLLMLLVLARTLNMTQGSRPWVLAIHFLFWKKILIKNFKRIFKSSDLPPLPDTILLLGVFFKDPAHAALLSSKSGRGTCLRPAASATCFLLSSWVSPPSWILTCLPSPAITEISTGCLGWASRIAFILASLCLVRACLTWQ